MFFKYFHLLVGPWWRRWPVAAAAMVAAAAGGWSALLGSAVARGGAVASVLA